MIVKTAMHNLMTVKTAMHSVVDPDTHGSVSGSRSMEIYQIKGFYTFVVGMFLIYCSLQYIFYLKIQLFFSFKV
jgi:hypothetical protein